MIAAVAGFVLGRISINLPSIGGAPGQPEVVDSELAEYQEDQPGTAPEASELLPVGDAPFVGKASAKVTLVMFSEFQCPYSRRVVGSLMALMDEYESDELKIMFLHYPLGFHDQAQGAAEASLAAHAQGKFWAFHDMLFNNQHALDRDSLEEYAEELDLDMDAFRAALDDGTYTEQVRAEMRLGAQYGINGTPSFLINGELLVGAQPQAAFQAIIDDEIEAADELIESGVALSGVFQRRVQENLPDAEEPTPAERPAEVPSGALEPRPTAPTVGTLPDRRQERGGPVELAVFADFTSPEYRDFGATLDRLAAEFGENLELSYTSVVDVENPNATLVAAALREADHQGRWQFFHAGLLAENGELTQDTLIQVAQRTGLDTAAFGAAVNRDDLGALAQNDLERARQHGVSATPTVYLQEQRLVGSVPYSDLQEMISGELGP